MRFEPFERIWLRVTKADTGCWLWTVHLSKDGYGKYAGGTAHRRVYELLVEPIPDGVHLHHKCMNPRCVNPAHLEPVTASQNNRERRRQPTEGRGLRTHCTNGHEYTPENTTYVEGRGRRCRACDRLRMRRNRLSVRAAQNAERQDILDLWGTA